MCGALQLILDYDGSIRGLSSLPLPDSPFAVKAFADALFYLVSSVKRAIDEDWSLTGHKELGEDVVKVSLVYPPAERQPAYQGLQ